MTDFNSATKYKPTKKKENFTYQNVNKAELPYFRIEIYRKELK